MTASSATAADKVSSEEKRRTYFVITLPKQFKFPTSGPTINFNIGQAPGPADLEEVVRAGAGRPLTVRRKWNGYLGIVSVIDGRLRVFSKSGVTAYSEHARSLLEAHLGGRADELAERIAEAGVSLTFEVISRRDSLDRKSVV